MIPSDPEPVYCNRYLLSKTWYDILKRIAGRHPSMMDSAMVDIAYNKICNRINQMTDQELMADMQDIVDSIDFARVNLGLEPRGLYKK